MSKWTHVHFVEIEVMKTRDSGKKRDLGKHATKVANKALYSSLTLFTMPKGIILAQYKIAVQNC